MSSFPVTITSADYNSSNQRFVKDFKTNFDFSKYEMSVQSLSMYNSTKNISAALGNDTITLAVPLKFANNPITGAALGSPVNGWTFTIKLDPGYYSVSDIEAFITTQLYLWGIYLISDDGNNANYFFNLDEDPTAYGVRLVLQKVQAITGYSIPAGATWSFFGGGDPPKTTMTFGIPSDSLFGNLIGFKAGTNYGNSTSDYAVKSTFCPVISPVSSYIFGCDLVSNQLCTPPSTIFTCGILAGNGEQFSAPIYTPMWLKCNGTRSSIEITIYDQTGAISPLYDTEFNMVLLFRQIA